MAVTLGSTITGMLFLAFLIWLTYHIVMLENRLNAGRYRRSRRTYTTHYSQKKYRKRPYKTSHYRRKQRSKNYIDDNGYLRDKKTHRLIHRAVAYRHLYDESLYSLPFSEYVVHHIDKDKRNNRRDNLMILTPEEHDRIHSRD